MVRFTNTEVPFTFQFTVTTSGTPEQLTVKLQGTTIAFNDNGDDADTITDSGNGFLIAGFQAGDQLTVAGSTSNDGTYVVSSVTAGTITLLANESLTTEAAGGTVTLTAPKTVPAGVSITVKALNANTGTIHIADSSAKAVNTTTGNFSLQNNETMDWQIDNTSRLWVDASVSGEGVEVFFEKQLKA